VQISNIDLNIVLEEFLTEQSDLLINDASEQAISHQLAMKLAGLFTDWTIGCEYNREGSVVKRLIYAVSPDGEGIERNVVPDIIIHRRQTTDNLLAIEIKKSTNQENSIKDLNKLEAFRGQLGYVHTLFVRFKTGAVNPEIAEIEFK
tara:strand:+ start:83 stop:523 length:441 start_codon:yes stop_codon:yes gene_type:complete